MRKNLKSLMSLQARALPASVVIAALVAGGHLPHGLIGQARGQTAAVEKRKPLGFMAAPVPPGSKEILRLAKDRGMIVVAVTPGGIADRAGLRKGDVLMAIDGRPIASQADLEAALYAAAPARKAIAQVSRQGAILAIAFGM
jgi:S1-C subfamily serine protease